MADVTTPFGFPYPEPTDLVRDGATDIEALAQAANDQFSAGFQFAGQRIYTSSGTFVKADPLGTGDIGLRAIKVRVQGGGGGGSSATTARPKGAGGGGGAYGERFITDMSLLGTSETVTRGAGGAGGAIGSSGSSGASSSFGSLVSATGGAAGTFDGNAGEGGGTTGNADVAFLGSGGEGGSFTNTNIKGGGAGGSSHLGGGSRGLGPFNIDGVPGRIHGGGGGGASAASADRAGGAGANGVVIVEVFV